MNVGSELSLQSLTDGQPIGVRGQSGFDEVFESP